MIKETTFLDCKVLPNILKGRFDQPWYFLGEVKKAVPCIQAICGRCLPTYSVLDEQKLFSDPYHVFSMDGHLFMTGDMLWVTVYFGACKECDSFYWARQGPPFKRVSKHVPAMNK